MVTKGKTDPAKLLFTVRETARVLAIIERTLFSLTKRGEIKRLKIGRSVRYSVEQLKRWIDEHEQEGGSDA